MDLHLSIIEELARKMLVMKEEVARQSFVRDLLADLIPCLPHTLNKHFVLSDIWTGYSNPPETSEYTLLLRTKEGIADEDVAQAFGTIVKVAAALLQLGWSVEPQPVIVATEYTTKHTLDVSVKAKHGPTGLKITFLHLPESERCKLVEEQVLVPERYETKLTVVCEDDPVQLVDPPPPVMANSPQLEESQP